MSAAYPSPARSHLLLALLLLAYILSFIDRYILAILVGPIRAEFEISDFQFSILHGWAFTLFYIVLGLPIAWLADRYNRRNIVSAGVFLWSLMTAACGFANQFITLFLARIGVGVGEAALSPAAYSLLSDAYPPGRLRWATSIYAAGITLGSGTAFMVGGWVYEQLLLVAPLSVPQMGWEFKAWQLTFIAVGLPGVLIALLLLCLAEPPRRQNMSANTSPKQATTETSWADVKRHLSRYRSAYTGLIGGLSMMSIMGYGTLTWYPEFLFRTYGMGKAEAGAWLGSFFIIAGTAGTFSGPWFAGLLQRKGWNDANMRLVLWVALILIVPSIAAPMMPNPTLALLLLAPIIFIFYTHFGVAMAALQLITPNGMRAQISALLLFMTNLFGLALGGSFIAFFTDFVFRGDQYLYRSLAVSALLIYPLAALLIARGLPQYREALSTVLGDGD